MTTNKVAIVSGASDGIGAGLVAEYRRRGWAVVASARTIEPSQDPDLLTVAGDIAEPATAGRIIDAALARFGRIDTLVNSVGVSISKPFTDYTAADYGPIVVAGLTGFFWLTQRAIAEMATRYGGHVVTVSVTLVEAPDYGTPADYGTPEVAGTPAVLAALARGGLAAATRSLAIEYAAHGIRVNAVFPGVIQTPVHPAGCYDGRGARLSALGRADRVSDIVAGVLFLESSPRITGEILHIDGGRGAEDERI
jgi:NAD(P)-dependent dehydrogenase (short-subunit alcohol dehydrogenase family)